MVLEMVRNGRKEFAKCPLLRSPRCRSPDPGQILRSPDPEQILSSPDPEQILRSPDPEQIVKSLLKV
jgi:hypothetical protein